MSSHNYELVRPAVLGLLEKLSLDKIYTKAKGNYLYYSSESEEEIKVLDFIGGYGSLFLGHNHPNLTSYACELITRGIPFHSQMSIKRHSGALCKAISDEIESYSGKSYISTLCNSGAEAVEAAIKHMHLTFACKITDLQEQVHRELNVISSFYSKRSQQLSIKLGDKSFDDFQTFKRYITGLNDHLIKESEPYILASKKSFHGKTIAALSVTHNPKFKAMFQVKEEKGVEFFEWDERNIDQLLYRHVQLIVPIISTNEEIILQKVSVPLCMGVIVEPILGEGGIRKVPFNILSFLRESTLKLNIPLVFDEIQCGFFRTGTFLYSMKTSIYADYYLVGKSLGGGMCKIAALIIDKDKYSEDFGLVHTSTYAEDEFSSAIALKSFQISKEKSGEVETIHTMLSTRLNKLQKKYIEVIEEVRSEGLMFGLSLKNMEKSSSYSFQMVSRTGYLSYFVCSYILAHYNIRLAPTLSDGFTLRLQPSILTTEEEIDRIVNALEGIFEIIYKRDFYKFIEHLLDKEHQGLRELTDYGRGVVPCDEVPEGLMSVGFITHYINESGVRAGDESMAVLSDDAINQLLDTVIPIAAPIFAGNKVVSSIDGSKINAVFAGLLFTANMARKVMVSDSTHEYEKMCERAVTMLEEDFSCKTIGLGQYTSVVTKNGKTLCNSNLNITTGNSFTVSIGLDALFSEVSTEIQNKLPLSLGVLGAGGNISSVYCKCFAPYCTNIYLKGSDSRDGLYKTKRVAKDLLSYLIQLIIDKQHDKMNPDLYETLVTSETFLRIANKEISLSSNNLWDILEEELQDNNPIKLITELDELVKCKLVVVATNHPHPFLESKYFSPDTIVYDISVPINCTEELMNNTKNIKVVLGGIVQLPFNESLPMKGYPLNNGEAFACISETILLGLENFQGNFSFGNLTVGQIERIAKIGRKHGFKYLKPKLEEIF